MMAVNKSTIAVSLFVSACGRSEPNICTSESIVSIGEHAVETRFGKSMGIRLIGPEITQKGNDWRLEYGIPGYMGGAPVVYIDKHSCVIDKILLSQ